jgi:outer membrane protein assembly factor BamE (lipoprotein component of BamABCDE complex)
MFSQNAVKYFFILLISFSTVSCTNTGNQNLSSENQASLDSKIKKGVTNKNEIISFFGAPSTKSKGDDQSELWHYELSELTVDASTFIPFVGFFSSSSSGVKKQLIVSFDQHDLMNNFEMIESDVKMKTGILNP